MKEPDYIVQLDRLDAEDVKADCPDDDLKEALNQAIEDVSVRNRRKVSILIEVTK